MTFTSAFARLGYHLSSPRTDWSAEKDDGICLSIWAKEMKPKRPGSSFDTRSDAQPIETWNHKQGFKRRLPHLARAVAEFDGYVDVVVVTGTPGEGHGDANPHRAPPPFRHPPASRAFAAQTGGRSGARERETVADSTASDIVREQVAFGAAASPGLRFASPEDDEG